MPTTEDFARALGGATSFTMYVRVGPSHIAGVEPDNTSHSVPPIAVPKAQAYYWTYVWQESERESLADLAAGRYRRFTDPTDAIRWLLSDD